ncbi:unnamed protein product [Parajaminaea phylloscopi]
MDDSDVWGDAGTEPKPASPSASPPVSPTSRAQDPARDVTPADGEGSGSQRPISRSFLDEDLSAGWGAPTPQAVEDTASNARNDTVTGSTDPEEAEEATIVDPPVDAAPHTAASDSSTNGADDFADFEDDAGLPPSAVQDASVSNEPQSKDDDFGDFGDFPDDAGDIAANDDFGDDGFGDEPFGEDAFADKAPDANLTQAGPPSQTRAVESAMSWQPLKVLDDDGKPNSLSSLTAQIRTILSAPLNPGGPSDPFGDGAASELSSDPIRQVEGPAQVLPAESSRRVLATLAKPPQLEPVDWLRSRTRKDFYISLGVPINLDELQASGPSSSKLPPLTLNYESGSSADAGSNSGLRRTASGHFASSQGPDSAAPVRSASTAGSTPNRSASTDAAKKQKMRERRLVDLGLGPMPEVDMTRLNEVCGLTEDQLSLLPLPSLRSLSGELENLARATSMRLTHHLALRESLQADSEMYNGLIKDLVRGAANTLAGSKDSNNSSSSRRSVVSGSSSAGPASKRFTSGGGPGSGGILSRSASPRPQSPLARPVTGSASAAVRR